MSSRIYSNLVFVAKGLPIRQNAKGACRSMWSLRLQTSRLYNEQRRYITEDSWAAEGLKRAGEKIEAGSKSEPITVTDDMLEIPSPKVSKIIDEILQLNVIEVNCMIRTLQKRLGISNSMIGGGGVASGAAAAPAAAQAAAPAAEPVKEKEAFDVKLGAVDAKAKIKVIKEVRTVTGLGLKEAKELVEKAPVVLKTGLKKEEAESIKKIMVEAGAQVEII